MIRRPPRSTQSRSSAASDVYKRQEVIQAYLEGPAGGPERPVRWLAGFAVAHVKAGAGAAVHVDVPLRALQVWDVDEHGWTIPAGTYRLRVGRSVRDLRLGTEVSLSLIHISEPTRLGMIS